MRRVEWIKRRLYLVTHASCSGKVPHTWSRKLGCEWERSWWETTCWGRFYFARQAEASCTWRERGVMIQLSLSLVYLFLPLFLWLLLVVSSLFHPWAGSRSRRIRERERERGQNVCQWCCWGQEHPQATSCITFSSCLWQKNFYKPDWPERWCRYQAREEYSAMEETTRDAITFAFAEWRESDPLKITATVRVARAGERRRPDWWKVTSNRKEVRENIGCGGSGSESQRSKEKGNGKLKGHTASFLFFFIRMNWWKMEQRAPTTIQPYFRRDGLATP